MAHVVGFREAATWSAVYRGADALMATRSASPRRRPIEGSTPRSGSRPVGELLVPLFFVAVGMNADSQALNPFAQADGFGLALVLTVAAIASKLAAGFAVYRRGVRRWLVAVGMVPRGEVGAAGRLTRRTGSATVSASTMSGRPAGCGPQGRRCESAATPSL